MSRRSATWAIGVGRVAGAGELGHRDDGVAGLGGDRDHPGSLYRRTRAETKRALLASGRQRGSERARLGWGDRPADRAGRSVPGPRPGRGAEEMSDERRCLVVDGHPLVRLGVRRLLDERFDVEEAVDGRRRARAADATTASSTSRSSTSVRAPARPPVSGTDAIRALRKASPGLGIVAHGPRAERQAATEAIKAGATAYVAKSSPAEELTKAVDAAADSETFVDPAANGQGRARADPPPAPDPPDDRRRPLDRSGRRSASASPPRPSAPTRRPPSPASEPATAPTRSRSASASVD